MRQKNIVKRIKGVLCYSQSTYARMYGRDRREVFQAIKSGDLKFIEKDGEKFVIDDPLPSWTRDPDFDPTAKPKKRKKRPATIQEPLTVPASPAPVQPEEEYHADVESRDVPPPLPVVPDTSASVPASVPASAPAPSRPRQTPALNESKAKKLAAEAETAELKLADLKGKLGEKYVGIFIDAFLEALPAFKQTQSELELSQEDIRRLQAATDKLASDTVKAAKRILSGGEVVEAANDEHA